MSQETKDQNRETQVKELFRLGAHFGFSRAKRHPSVRNFIFGFKNRTAVIDLEKSLEALEDAKAFVSKIAASGKQLLFVGTKPEAREIIASAANSVDMPYVNERWIGGTMTNFSEIKKRVARLRDLQTQRESGELIKYKKKERGMIGKEIEDLERYFSSIMNMTELPAAIFTIDAKEEGIAIMEAIKSKIPVISLSSSDCDIRNIDYPIVANDSSRQSIEFFVKEIAQAYHAGKAQTQAKEEQSAEPLTA